MNNTNIGNDYYKNGKKNNNNQWSNNVNGHQKKSNRSKNTNKIQVKNNNNIHDIEKAFQFEPNDLTLRTFPNHAQQSLLNFNKQMNQDDYNFYDYRSQFENELKKTNPNNKHDFQFLFSNYNRGNKQQSQSFAF
jgi:hypothetical protein